MCGWRAGGRQFVAPAGPRAPRARGGEAEADGAHRRLGNRVGPLRAHLTASHEDHRAPDAPRAPTEATWPVPDRAQPRAGRGSRTGRTRAAGRFMEEGAAAVRCVSSALPDVPRRRVRTCTCADSLDRSRVDCLPPYFRKTQAGLFTLKPAKGQLPHHSNFSGQNQARPRRLSCRPAAPFESLCRRL